MSVSHGRYDGMGPATYWAAAPSLADLTCAAFLLTADLSPCHVGNRLRFECCAQSIALECS